MVKPICPKCGHDYFISTRLNYPVPHIDEVYLIHCHKCGCIVGVVSSK